MAEGSGDDCPWERGAFLTDGDGLYQVLRAAYGTVLLEDCNNPSRTVVIPIKRLLADRWRVVDPT